MTAAWHFGLYMSTDQQTRRGVSILVGVTDPDEQEQVGLLLPNDRGRNICGIQVICLGMS